jgi:hypothetical protein
MGTGTTRHGTTIWHFHFVVKRVSGPSSFTLILRMCETSALVRLCHPPILLCRPQHFLNSIWLSKTELPSGYLGLRVKIHIMRTVFSCCSSAVTEAVPRTSCRLLDYPCARWTSSASRWSVWELLQYDHAHEVCHEYDASSVLNKFVQLSQYTVWTTGIRSPAGEEKFSLHRVQTGSGAHPASYPVGTGTCFTGGKAAGAWSWPLTSV